MEGKAKSWRGRDREEGESGGEAEKYFQGRKTPRAGKKFWLTIELFSHVILGQNRLQALCARVFLVQLWLKGE